MSQAQVADPPRTSPSQRRPWLVRLEPSLPKSVLCFREGYSRDLILHDLLAGVTVGVIALPLAMAFAINSGPGLKPEVGLYTAIVAGFLVSLLSGSRVQIAGPTGAFMPILYLIVEKHGYQGLAIATIMAGVILLIMAVAKLGSMIKFIPYPVTTGFTSGIAVIIFSSQMKDFFGLEMPSPPPDFIAKWYSYVQAFGEHGISRWTTGIAVGGVLVIGLLRRFAPRIPGAIVAVILASIFVSAMGLDQKDATGRPTVETVGTKFGGIPRTPPRPSLSFLHSDNPDHQLNFSKVRELVPEATTIAMLAAIESLLCCVVADGMIGGRHKSNVELAAQGVGNIASILFGGIPATGAIARTAANVKSGGRTPLAGMIHAIFVLLCMLALAPLASKIPMPVFASILVFVAWNMSEKDHFTHIFKAPRSDIAVLLTTFGLTVLTDLTIAVAVGMVLAAMLFMKRMTEVTNVGALREEIEERGSDLSTRADPNAIQSRDVPKGVEVFEINGPFFFGVADRLKDTLRGLTRPPKAFILRMRRVDAVDATGLHALDEFHDKCRKQGTTLLLSGVHAQPMFAMTRYGLLDKIGESNMYGNIHDALNRARELTGGLTQPKPASALPEVARERH